LKLTVFNFVYFVVKNKMYFYFEPRIIFSRSDDNSVSSACAYWKKNISMPMSTDVAAILQQ
jgi:hypothetical protein